MLNENTIFEIGSATKVFTALLVLSLVEQGKMSLDDPLEKYLPKDVPVPSRNNRKILLKDLLTHTSGLPYHLDNFHPADLENPYADYTVKDMYEFLAQYTLTRDIGAQYEYSNIGYGLLGHSVELYTGMSLAHLIHVYITQPLLMQKTMVTVPESLSADCAQGYAYGQAVPNWDFAGMGAAGGLRSTAFDMVRFLQAHMGIIASDLFSPMKKMQQIQVSTGIPMPHLAMGYGWHINTRAESPIFWHTGGTGGNSSFIGFDVKARRGVVILRNHPFALQNLGLHLINSAIPLDDIKEISIVDVDVLKKYVGIYELAPTVRIRVNFRNGRLVFVQDSIQYDFEIFPETQTRFYAPLLESHIEFQVNEKQDVTGLLWLVNDMKIPAKKTA